MRVGSASTGPQILAEPRPLTLAGFSGADRLFKTSVDAVSALRE